MVPAEFVTLDTGTGIVHQAPAFGEVDYDVLLDEQRRFLPGEGPELINAVAAGRPIHSNAPDYQGRWVKDADQDIIRGMRSEGPLFHQEQYLHDYPVLLAGGRRSADPVSSPQLVHPHEPAQRPHAGQQRQNQLAAGPHPRRPLRQLPGDQRRLGPFPRAYWGTPLPIWVCEETGFAEAVASYAELLAKPGISGTEVWEQAKQADPDLPEDLKVHKPYIDAVTYDSPRAAGKRMRRVSEVIDCWFDSGAMPFAQWGYPHQPGSAERFQGHFPADFISEAIDQTRGWFYSLLAISTLLFSDGMKAQASPTPPRLPCPTRIRIATASCWG